MQALRIGLFIAAAVFTTSAQADVKMRNHVSGEDAIQVLQAVIGLRFNPRHVESFSCIKDLAGIVDSVDIAGACLYNNPNKIAHMRLFTWNKKWRNEVGDETFLNDILGLSYRFPKDVDFIEKNPLGFDATVRPGCLRCREMSVEIGGRSVRLVRGKPTASFSNGEANVGPYIYMAWFEAKRPALAVIYKGNWKDESPREEVDAILQAFEFK